MKKNYRSTYNIVKKLNKGIRNVSQKKHLGLDDKIENSVKKGIGICAYKVTGKFYDKKKHSPCVGSIIYTIMYFLICMFLFGIVSFVIEYIF